MCPLTDSTAESLVCILLALQALQVRGSGRTGMFAHDVKEAVVVLAIDDQLNDRHRGTSTILLSPCQGLLKQTSHQAAHTGVLQTTFHSRPATFLLMLAHSSSCHTHGP